MGPPRSCDLESGQASLQRGRPVSMYLSQPPPHPQVPAYGSSKVRGVAGVWEGRGHGEGRGGGSGGLHVPQPAAASAGARVRVVEGERWGGDWRRGLGRGGEGMGRGVEEGRERQSGAGQGGVSEARLGGWGRGVAEPYLPATERAYR